MLARTAVAAVCLALGLGLAAEAAAQKAPVAPPGPNTKAIAAQIVKQVANVKPGDNAVGFGSYWHLPGSTLTIDGQPLVEKGELKVAGAGVAAK